MLLFSSGDELKDIDIEAGCGIISEEHFGHLPLSSSGILKSLANLLIFDETIFLLLLSFLRLEVTLSWVPLVLFLIIVIG
jgi:hypothetical protein